MGVVAAAGLASAIISVLPRLMASGRLNSLPHRPLARRAHDGDAWGRGRRWSWKAMVFVLACWVARAVGLFLLAALGVSVSFPLALEFLVAAASLALPSLLPAPPLRPAQAPRSSLRAESAHRRRSPSPSPPRRFSSQLPQSCSSSPPSGGTAQRFCPLRATA